MLVVARHACDCDREQQRRLSAYLGEEGGQCLSPESKSITCLLFVGGVFMHAWMFWLMHKAAIM